MGELVEFGKSKMKMSLICQPVMIKTLLKAGGSAEKKLIAKKILEYDFSQVEYYENITSALGKELRRT